MLVANSQSLPALAAHAAAALATLVAAALATATATAAAAVTHFVHELGPLYFDGVAGGPPGGLCGKGEAIL